MRRDEFERCPYCGARVLKGNYGTHVANAHPGELEGDFEHPSDTGSNELHEFNPRDLNLDATRDDYIWRDNGEFGSTPSYDDYSDEGQP
jgi:hypothetical protein